MSNHEESDEISAANESRETTAEKVAAINFVDYFVLAVTTFGVGYLPLAPGTWGSLVGVGIYLSFGIFENSISESFAAKGYGDLQITAWVQAINLLIFLLFCLVGIWAASRATVLFGKKDPQQAVVDEVIGQLIVYLFIPFDTHWYFVLAGFLLFRLFDIWKPYPINLLENLPAGLGVCADDILAGIYGGICLSIIYALSFSW